MNPYGEWKAYRTPNPKVASLNPAKGAAVWMELLFLFSFFIFENEIKKSNIFKTFMYEKFPNFRNFQKRNTHHF